MNEILGKIAIITGASGGIGAATALNFAREGADGIVIADLDSENAKVTINNIMKETNCRCEFIKTNIGKKDDIENLNLIKNKKNNFICIDNLGIQINECHQRIFNTFVDDFIRKDIDILGLEIIKFNLEKKRRLNEIYKEYYSEEFIKELLLKLYEKNIEIIQSQIS